MGGSDENDDAVNVCDLSCNSTLCVSSLFIHWYLAIIINITILTAHHHIDLRIPQQQHTHTINRFMLNQWHINPHNKGMLLF